MSIDNNTPELLLPPLPQKWYLSPGEAARAAEILEEVARDYLLTSNEAIGAGHIFPDKDICICHALEQWKKCQNPLTKNDIGIVMTIKWGYIAEALLPHKTLGSWWTARTSVVASVITFQTLRHAWVRQMIQDLKEIAKE